MSLANSRKDAIPRKGVPNRRRDLPNYRGESCSRNNDWERNVAEPIPRATGSNDWAPDASPSHNHSIL